MSNLLHVGLILIISKVFTILCLLCLCRNREYHSNFQSKTVISTLLSNECTSKVRGKVFLKWTRSIDLSSISYLHIGLMLIVIKVFIIPFLFCLWEQGEKKAFFWNGERRGTTLQDSHLDDTRDEKVSPFVKFEMILPLFCFLLDPLTNKHCSTWSSMINLWIDYRTCQKQRILLSVRPRFNYNYFSQTTNQFFLKICIILQCHES